MTFTANPSRWTLRTQLVVSLIALFLITTAAVGSLTVVALRNTLTNQVDQQLTSSAQMLANGGPGNGGGPAGSPGNGGSLRVDLGPNDTVVTAWDYETRTRVPRAYVTRLGGENIALTSGQVSQLREAGIGSNPTTISLGDLGRYRVVAVQNQQLVRTGTSDSDVSVVEVSSVIGVPVDWVTSTVARTALAIALLSGAGVLLVAAGVAWIVRRTLQPLRRVAATATRVSHLPLSEGKVEMSDRVAEADTDPGTEVGQVGLALNEMLDHVNHALDARYASELQVRQFVADASHELRTPLASIRGYAELSRREKEPVPQTVSHALGRIESEADRMTTLVEDLLLLARLDAGRPLERSEVDVTRLLLETIGDAHAASPDHDWQLDLPDEPVELEGDEARLRQVIINLLGNARRHTPAGTKVVASARTVGDQVEISIADNGPGIDPELVPRIFERFTRGDEARTRTEGSTGLGLSIVSAVVAAHHGTVTVSSEPGNTVFRISLPARQPDETAEESADRVLANR
ncbi:two-component system OmpR family sensor kinase [Branchiibius hedensis]|uniref:histidine kinase n=1 Tax=Branchiibius hedensis TaxID=672460 RepID=A0A2Y9A0Y6_9MICO|nr:HAMP domain-containing sensor histidine kinase [Branchiibius hedensis]PWJ27358.1 two-component system OmpR family sensor kinase [Branchiibius hedensis]SSA36169.1 two-component system, OmpR family, sensor kinase [Branchiibius hedensis]